MLPKLIALAINCALYRFMNTVKLYDMFRFTHVLTLSKPRKEQTVTRKKTKQLGELLTSM
jgi:hypothetical protein